MPVEVQMPKLGLTMEEGTVVEWLKAQGAVVEEGQPLFVLETDKLTLEAEAPVSGVLDQILVPAGTTVATGTPVGLILLAGEEVAGTVRDDPGQKKARTTARPKATATPVAHRLAEQAGLDLASVKGTGRGGRVTARDVEQVLASARDAGAVLGKTFPDGVPVETRPKAKASPRARRLAAEAGLDLATVEGTGRHGRVMAEDVERALAQPRISSDAADEADGDHQAPALGARRGTSTAVALSGVRGVIAQRMSASAQTTAAVTTMTQADATEMVHVREALRNEWQTTTGLAPSYSDLLLVILAKALGEFPYMNAHLVGKEIRQIADINIGLAVHTDRGLLVPVIKGVQSMMLADVTHSSHDLVRRAREGKLMPDDLSGGTFTLSNMGRFDVEASTPIINLPECAILGVGRIAARPAVYEGGLCIRQTVTLSLTYDHRAIDGVPAAHFLERVKDLVERPSLALVR